MFIFLLLDDLIAAIAKTKALLLEKADPNASRTQQEITEEIDLVVHSATSKLYKMAVSANFS